MANVSREQKEIVRGRILEAAKRLFAEKGFQGTTTREIAAEAEVSESSIFTYFGTKEELLVRIVLPDPVALAVPIQALTPWQAATTINRLHFEPLDRLDKRLLCEYQATINRAAANLPSPIISATAHRDQLYAVWLRQVLDAFDVEETPIVMEIIIAVVLCVFQAYMTRPAFTFGQFLAQSEEQIHFLLRLVHYRKPGTNLTILLAAEEHAPNSPRSR